MLSFCRLISARLSLVAEGGQLHFDRHGIEGRDEPQNSNQGRRAAVAFV
jgi:hypothetical protein